MPLSFLSVVLLFGVSVATLVFLLHRLGVVRTFLFLFVLAVLVIGVFRGSGALGFATTSLAHLSSTFAGTAPDERIDRAPTVTAALIDQVLAAAHSPARGLGPVLYRLGVQAHIDPAVPLAFFHHESDYGRTGVAATTHSIGNIRCSAGYSCYQGYRWYSSWAASVADWYSTLHMVYLSEHLTTLEAIVPLYAPRADGNDEGAYLTSVRADLARWRTGQV